jgi:hypothetical protein
LPETDTLAPDNQRNFPDLLFRIKGAIVFFLFFTMQNVSYCPKRSDPAPDFAKTNPRGRPATRSKDGNAKCLTCVRPHCRLLYFTMREAVGSMPRVRNASAPGAKKMPVAQHTPVLQS